jgi:hypothetical protein
MNEVEARALFEQVMRDLPPFSPEVWDDWGDMIK